ncbi:MAG TPA: Gfo/Idh/MocA family oxidoreductase [Ilumatobacteraceae bacterium]|nr:Gfo/Idh/MocA family oxidoreductase [Ilumatobacteraceae bacterium]
MAENSKQTPLRWGIAATGSIAASMCEALRTLPGADITAVGSRSQDSADHFAQRFEIPRAHGSYEALWADDEVDIVYIASPHSHHHAMATAALDAGKHVLCEKAFAVNAGQAREMVDAARRNDRFLMEAMWTWFIPAVVDIRRRVLDGEIGELKVVAADFGLPIHDPDGRHRRIDLAGGAMLDLGIYPVTFGRFLAGDPIDVQVSGTLGDSGVDTTVGGVVTYAGGALGVFHTSLDVLTNRGASAYGTLGRIDVDAPFWHPDRFTVRLNGQEDLHVDMPNQGLAHEAAHAMERIRDGHRESDVIPLATSVSTMELLDDIRAQLGVVYPEER